MHYGQTESMHAADKIASSTWVHVRDIPSVPASEAGSSGVDGVNGPSEPVPAQAAEPPGEGDAEPVVATDYSALLASLESIRREPVGENGA